MDQSLVVILQLRVGMTRFLLFQRKSLDLFAADSSLGLFQKAFFADVLTDVCLTLLLHFLDIELRQVEGRRSCLDILFCLGVVAEHLQKTIEIGLVLLLFLFVLPLCAYGLLLLYGGFVLIFKGVSLGFGVLSLSKS